jgi:hypothetical protein
MDSSQADRVSINQLERQHYSQVEFREFVQQTLCCNMYSPAVGIGYVFKSARLEQRYSRQARATLPSVREPGGLRGNQPTYKADQPGTTP